MARFNAVWIVSLLLIGSFSFIGSAGAQQDPDAWLVKGLVNETLEAERTGAEVPWSNANTGNSGVIRVERTYYRADGTPCREYVRTTKQPDGAQSTTEGTGCRIADGRWFLDEAPSTQASPPRSTKRTGAATTAKEQAPSARGASTEDDSPETGAKTVAAVRRADESPSAKSGAPEGERTEKWSIPIPPAKPQAPDFTLPSKSEM